MSQPNRGNGQTTETFRVVGLSSHTEALKRLAKLNPDWNLTPDAIADSGRAGQKIYKLKFINKPVELRPDSDSVTVVISGQEIGSIRPEDCAHVKDILDNYDVQNLVCGIWGGQYKTVDDFYDVTTQQQGIAATVKIVYSSMSLLLDDAESEFAIDYNAPEYHQRKSTKPAKKAKVKKPIFKRWWFWAIIVLVALIAICGSGEPAEENTQNTIPSKVTEATESKATAAPTTETVAYTTEATATDASQALDMDAVVSFVEAILKDNFENYEVSHNDGIITINVWQDGIAAGAVFAQYGNQECLDSWNTLVENQKHLCLSVLDLVKTLGASDTSVVLNVLNDADTDKTLLSVIDGVVLYNAVSNE